MRLVQARQKALEFFEVEELSAIGHTGLPFVIDEPVQIAKRLRKGHGHGSFSPIAAASAKRCLTKVVSSVERNFPAGGHWVLASSAEWMALKSRSGLARSSSFRV